MTRRRTIQFVCIVFAVFAMAISAVAACACTHHQVKKREKKTLSCHAPSHEDEQNEVSTDDPQRHHFGESCNCFVSRVQPAIIAKSEQKKFKTQQTDVTEDVAAFEFETQTVLSVEVLAVRSEFNFYTKVLPRSGPSRAPPRL